MVHYFIMKQVTKYVYFILALSLISISGCGSGTKSVQSASEISYKIGHEQLHYPVTAELFYPSELGEKDSIIADARFPLIVFAHGYQQFYSDYRYLWEALVPKGYIVAFLTTQQGLSINIDTYADDIISLHNELHTTHHISRYITNKSALMGHSTGGGAIYLAEEKLAQSTTLISLAALGEPYGPIFGSSPIDIAGNITVPILTLSGDKDCITPVDIHQKPLYDALVTDKTMVTISGGDHCGFTNSSICSAAEALSCALLFQGATISEEQQRTFTLLLITSWLNHYLKSNPDSWPQFLSLQESILLNYE